MPRRPTIIDVARLAGVSKATVARVVSGQDALVKESTRERVIIAVNQLGYERNAVAGSLRTDQTFMVAMCIPDITNPFWPAVVRGAQDTIETNGYTTVTVNSDWNAIREMNYVRMVSRNRFDALMINPTSVPSHVLRELGIPIVILGSGDNYPEFDSVGSDTERAVQQALDHLLTLGHRRIGLIAGRSRRRRELARYLSYRDFHARHGLPLDEALVIECEFSDRDGHTAVIQLLDLPDPPTAIFAANDILAIGAMKAVQAAGRRVPEDISIIGMDDIYAAAMASPALTTVAKPKYDIGVQAATLLLEHLRRIAPNTPRHVKLPCHLVERATTAPLRGGSSQ